MKKDPANRLVNLFETFFWSWIAERVLIVIITLLVGAVCIRVLWQAVGTFGW